MRFIVMVVCLALFATVAVSQRHREPDSAQHYSRGIAQSSGTAAKAKQSFPRPNWMVKYTSGSLGLKTDQWLRIAFVSRITSAQIANPSVNVPADQLVAIEFNPKTEKESPLLQGPRSGCSYARSMMPDTSKSRPEIVAAAAITPGPVSRLFERLRPKHPVRFVWNEEGEQKSMAVKVNDCEYQSFIGNIRWMVDARWQEIARALKQQR